MAQDARLPDDPPPAAVAASPPAAIGDAKLLVKGTPAIPGARVALTLLVLINLFNYIDRQVLAAVEPEIRTDFLSDFSEDNAKFWMGVLPFAFLISYMLLSPLFGVLADRYSRWALVGFGVVLWSVASGLSGMPWIALGVAASLGFAFLVVTRCFVGVGEAAYGPVAPAMIADLFPVQKRGMVLSFFYLAIPVGGALGYAVGEGIKDVFGWHWAFVCVVPPGLFLGVWAFLMRDPPKGLTDNVQGEPKKLTLAAVGNVLRIPSYTLNTIGMTFMTFAIGGMAYWMPDFLENRHIEAVGPIGPRTFFGILAAVGGLLSTLAGGIAGDWLRGRFSGSYFLVSGAALILGFPMLLGMVYATEPWLMWVFVFLAVFCLFFNTGPTNTILANVTHPTVRASAFAINILIIHLFGDAISPIIISLASRGQPNLDRGFILASALMAVGGVVWLVGARYLEEDTRRAPSRL
jgi:MFS family permease